MSMPEHEKPGTTFSLLPIYKSEYAAKQTHFRAGLERNVKKLICQSVNTAAILGCFGSLVR